jgi:hypothetical protein
MTIDRMMSLATGSSCSYRAAGALAFAVFQTPASVGSRRAIA